MLCFVIDGHYNCINEHSVNCARDKHYDPCAIVMLEEGTS